MKLIVVESPTKADTFKRFLKGKEYRIAATYGHIRDLPKNKLGVKIEEDFEPNYEIVRSKKKAISNLKKLARKASYVILATDADREGESIAYHAAYILGLAEEKWPKFKIENSDKIGRIVFHEITKEALDKSLSNPGGINVKLLKAQQTRRLLDRLVGYKLSPLLWKKMGKRWLSAGRVQTVALRFIVEREKEITSFKSEPYYKVQALFANGGEISADLISIEDQKIEKRTTIELFDGKYTYSKTTITKIKTKQIQDDLKNKTFKVANVQEKPFKKSPPPPFTTSTLQQQASRLYGYTPKLTMSLAQRLYEKGHITYHRTDSVVLNEGFLKNATKYIREEFGKRYALAKPRRFKTKSKLAQEAHEAIRPTKLSRLKKSQDGKLSARHIRLYDLIFKRAIASQMQAAEMESVKVQIRDERNIYLFESTWSKVIFEGYLKIYGDKKDAPDIYTPSTQAALSLNNLDFIKTETLAPPRYNEASLIKALEARAIGRPSTYAPIVSTIEDKNYVIKKTGRFKPTHLGNVVCEYLVGAFPDIFDVSFTAEMEDYLDQIAQGKQGMVEILSSFYKPFSKLIDKQVKSKGHIDVEEKTSEKCPECGNQIVIRYSKFGKFYACSNYPKCKYTKPHFEKIGRKCPECGAEMIIKYTRKGKKFYACSNYPECKFAAWRLSKIPKG